MVHTSGGRRVAWASSPEGQVREGPLRSAPASPARQQAMRSLRLPSAKVMAYTYLVPSWVILWELALGKGGPPLLVLGGVGLTMAALGLLLKE